MHCGVTMETKCLAGGFQLSSPGTPERGLALDATWSMWEKEVETRLQSLECLVKGFEVYSTSRQKYISKASTNKDNPIYDNY